jgi:hypothetical protein
MTETRLDLTRQQILAFRRHASAPDERLAYGENSLRRAAWAGLQDSMPRAAPLAARLELARRYLHVYGPTTREPTATSWSRSLTEEQRNRSPQPSVLALRRLPITFT